MKKIFVTIALIIVYLFGSIGNDNIVKAARNNDISSCDIQEFMDSFIEENMKEYNVPGVAAVVVKDGKEIYKRGYGYSDVNEKIEVKPEETLFPAASVSKLFTAVAIMQLYEEGKLDIYEDVEKYIRPYKIQNSYNEKVTCANLLTHSSGVDEGNEINGNTRDINKIKSQEYYFDNHRIKVVREPNTTSRYSNMGYNILGYIVEKVSGISYEEYINKNILEPLDMKNSLVRVKNENTAKGYEYVEDSFQEIPLTYQYTSGSSGVIGTVEDMEKFLLAILNNGEYRDNKILKKETIKEMKEKQFANEDLLPGMGYGFIRSNRNNKEIIKHEGALPGFTTTMFFLEDENIGIYLATNSLNPIPFKIEEEFLNYFYKVNNIRYDENKANVNKDYSKYEGIYRSYDGISKSNIMKALFLLDSEMDLIIKDNKDGTLTLKEFTSAKEENITRLVEIEEGVFAREDGKGDFTFKIEDNKVTYAFNDVSHNSFERIKFYEYRSVLIFLLITIMTIFFINIIVSIISRSLRRSGIVISLFNIIGFLGTLVLEIFMIISNDVSKMWLLYIFLVMLIIASVLSIRLLLKTIIDLNKKKFSKGKFNYLLVMNIANIIFIYLMYYINFLGFNL